MVISTANGCMAVYHLPQPVVNVHSCQGRPAGAGVSMLQAQVASRLPRGNVLIYYIRRSSFKFHKIANILFSPVLQF